MKRMLILFALLAFSGTALAGFSLGFKPLDLPYMVDGTGSYADMTNVPMLRIGWGASPEFRIEVLAGYDKWTWDGSDGTSEANGSIFSMGGSAFYVIASPSNTICSIGGSFVYSKASGEVGNTDIPGTSGYSIYPIIRVDFAIPGAERFALFTEFGARYVSATTDYEAGDAKYSDFGTWGSENILGGAYYSF